MARSFIRQSTQIRQSDTFDDTLSPGSALESAASSLESDLNGIRSQIRRIFHADSGGDWFSDVATVNGQKRGLDSLAADLNDLENKKVLFRSQLLTDVTVPGGQNYVVLVQANSETPTEAAAIGAGTANGVVTASLAGAVGSHSLNEVSGDTAINPKNLIIVRDAVTGEPIVSPPETGKNVYGLLQAASGVADGDLFDDATKQVQISFVVENSAGTDLVACPTADIAGKTLNYSYVRRLNFDSLPEQVFLSGLFTDQTATTADVTLNNAIDNQIGSVTQGQNIEIRISDTFHWKFQDPSGARDILRVSPASGGDVVQLNLDTLDINNVNAVDVAEGLTVDTSGTALSFGVTAGEISSAGALTLKSNAASNLVLSADNEIVLVDTNKSGSTFSSNLLLSDTSTEWNDFETQFGEVSLLRAIVKAKIDKSFDKAVAVVSAATIAADTNVTGAGGSPNIDAQLIDYSGKTFVSDVNVFVNGVLLRNGADATANHDVYPGSTPANGDLKFEFLLKLGDVITMEVF